MKRNTFLKKAASVAVMPVFSQHATIQDSDEINRIRQELLDAWRASEVRTMTIARQMPAEDYGFKYTPEAMTFAEQWRHCCLFTVGQMQADFGMPNLYTDKKLPKTMTREEVLEELPRMYAFVRKTIETTPAENLLKTVEFGEAKMPGWRILYAMENHIIHHRGQCVVYLRLK
jgi:hypothetical protein